MMRSAPPRSGRRVPEGAALAVDLRYAVQGQEQCARGRARIQFVGDNRAQAPVLLGRRAHEAACFAAVEQAVGKAHRSFVDIHHVQGTYAHHLRHAALRGGVEAVGSGGTYAPAQGVGPLGGGEVQHTVDAAAAD